MSRYELKETARHVQKDRKEKRLASVLRKKSNLLANLAIRHSIALVRLLRSLEFRSLFRFITSRIHYANSLQPFAKNSSNSQAIITRSFTSMTVRPIAPAIS